MLAAAKGAGGDGVINAFKTGAAGDLDARTPVRKGLRHPFVGGAELGPLAKQRRVIAVGNHQGVLDGLGIRVS